MGLCAAYDGRCIDEIRFDLVEILTITLNAPIGINNVQAFKGRDPKSLPMSSRTTTVLLRAPCPTMVPSIMRNDPATVCKVCVLEVGKH
jgi:hypothetical protein